MMNRRTLIHLIQRAFLLHGVCVTSRRPCTDRHFPMRVFHAANVTRASINALCMTFAVLRARFLSAVFRSLRFCSSSLRWCGRALYAKWHYDAVCFRINVIDFKTQFRWQMPRAWLRLMMFLPCPSIILPFSWCVCTFSFLLQHDPFSRYVNDAIFFFFFFFSCFQRMMRTKIRCRWLISSISCARARARNP